MKISEADFLTWVIECARLFGWRCAHFRSVRVQRKDGTVYYQTPVQGDPGLPDIILVRGGRVIFSELKADKGSLSPEQVEWGRVLSAAKSAGSPCEYYVWKPSDRDAIERLLR